MNLTKAGASGSANLPAGVKEALRALAYVELSEIGALEAGAIGSYVLEVRVRAPCRITVGRLGCLQLAPGTYAYSGSAMRGLRARVERHLRREKRRHWHVDYLLEVADVVAVWARVGGERMECAAAGALTATDGACCPLAGFGSSDCRCRSHLIAWPAAAPI